ncbi:MAG: AbiV family abortive infection protein [Candidatus Heimdallarchaeaceae archaeon]
MTKNKDEFYFEIIIKSLENAKQFHFDAKTLANIKSYGHAYALAVLGFEEVSKAWGIFYLQFGIYQEEDEIIQDLFKKHITKHFLGLESLSFIFMILWNDFVANTKYKDKLDNIKAIDENGESQIDVFKEQYWDLVLEMSTDEDKEIAEAANKFIELKQITDDFSRKNSFINNRKLLGLYVDVEFDNKTITGPEAFNEDNLEIISTLESFIEITETIMISFKQNITNTTLVQYKEFTKKIMQKVRELENKENKN